MAKKRKTTWQQYIAVIIAVIVVIVFGGWYYCNKVYLKPENVFWATMDRNLQTGSITKAYSEGNELQSYGLVTKLQFKGQLASQTTVVVKDETAGASSTVITNTVGTPTQDFLKYSQITSETAEVPQSAIGVWAVNTANDTQTAQVFLNELTSSPLLFGYLNHNQRSELIKAMRDNQAFEVDFASTDTTKEFNGKKVYSYDVTINLANYLPIYQTYLRMMGQAQLADQIGTSAPDATLAVTLLIEPVSRHLMQITIADNGGTLTFSNQDASQLIELPTDAQLSIDDLQLLLSGQ
jgi:hypothetical protein